MLLAIDTATRVISIALHDGAHLAAEASWETANYHTVELAPAVRAMLDRANLTMADLGVVAVALGPGSFTGLRIGLGLAKGLASALEIALVGVPTLEVLAASQPRSRGTLLAVVQAGRGRICAQPFSWKQNAWVPKAEPVISSWAGALAGIDKETVISGEIDDAGAAAIQAARDAGQPLSTPPAALRLRRAGFLAECGWARFNAGDVDDPFSLVPIYLHQPGVPHP